MRSCTERPPGVSRAMNSPQERSCLRSFCRTTRLYYEVFKFFVCIPCRRKVELHDPQQVLRSKLGDDLEVLDFTTEPLVKAGDNYGSTIVKLTVEARRKSTAETLHLVAKMLPSSRFLRRIYECEFTVAKEMFLYDEVIPAYEELYRDKLDIVPKFYGGRLAFKSDEIGVDEGAVILLENLKESGYIMEDRSKGLTMDHMNYAIPTIAKFHAIGLAIKHNNPEFYSKMQKHTRPLEMPEEVMGTLVPGILKMIKNSSQLRKYHERVKKLKVSNENTNCLMQIELEPDDPWACLVHRDLWKNNVMFHQEDGQINGFKFFDFQNYCLSSPMTDLMYFVCSSMERDFEHFDEAIELYRTSTQEILVHLGCDASMLEKECFDERLKKDAQSEIFHSIMIARTVEMRSMWEAMKATVNEYLVYRVRRILEIYDERGWF